MDTEPTKTATVDKADEGNDFETFSDEGEHELDRVPSDSGDESEEESDEDESSEDGSDESDDYEEPERPKDDTELELERLVFGDPTGFRDAVHGFHADDGEDRHNAETKAISAVPNDDLFFLDEGVGGAQPLAGLQLQDEEDEQPAPAWQDSDDERMTVSLMAVPRLRKLRTFEGEDSISGTEYVRRLRKQYEALHPRPAWANWKGQDRPSKRRRLSHDDSEDESEMDIDEDGGDAPASQTPLAKLLRDSAPLTRSSNASSQPDLPPPLKPGVVTIVRHPDIQPTQPHSINCLSIHPTLPLLLSAGLSSTMYLHRIQLRPVPPDPENPLLTSLHLKHTPLTTAAFSPGADGPTDPKIYLSGPRRYFHTWTLPSGAITKTTRIYGEQATTQTKCQTLRPSPCGRYLALQGTARKGGGVVNILSATTTQWLAQARADGRGGLADFAWWADGDGLSLATRTGEVTEWSVAARAVVARWADPGATQVTTLALGADPARRRRAPARPNPRCAGGADIGPDRHVALGLASGEVVLYDRRAVGADGAATPLRTLGQLATPVSSLAVSPCGGLLVAASRWKRDALRLVHLPSGTVYRNWPTAKTPFGRVASVALGEVFDGERTARVLAVGSENGALRLWEVGGG